MISRKTSQVSESGGFPALKADLSRGYTSELELFHDEIRKLLIIGANPSIPISEVGIHVRRKVALESSEPIRFINRQGINVHKDLQYPKSLK